MSRIALIATCLTMCLVPAAAMAAEEHTVVPADQLKWGPAPPAFPKGAQIAVLSGDPSKDGLYVLRLKVPAGYKVPAHTHPNDENVTVIAGTFVIGMGPKLDAMRGAAVKVGGFVHIPKGMQHYAWFTEESIIQVHGTGPQGIIYVDPAEDPRKSN